MSASNSPLLAGQVWGFSTVGVASPAVPFLGQHEPRATCLPFGTQFTSAKTGERGGLRACGGPWWCLM